MARSLWKGPYFKTITQNKGKVFMSRASTVLPVHLNKSFNIHNGRKGVNIKILAEMIGYKFGAFVPTKLK